MTIGQPRNTVPVQQPSAFGCVGNTIKLLSGKYLDLVRPEPDQFEFEDIAGALAKICRFGGQCKYFYSVAEHLVHCHEVARTDGRNKAERLAVFAHDFSEAFLGDVVKPLKLLLSEYRELEILMEMAISQKFGITYAPGTVQVVKEIDQSMLIHERRQLFDSDQVKWTDEDKARPLTVKLGHWSPGLAYQKFISTAAELGLV